MLIPTYYDDDVAEYRHLLEHVTIWDVAVERQVEIAGPDAARFTQLLTPRDLSHCDVGQCKYVTHLRPRRRHRQRPDPPASWPRTASGSRSRTPMPCCTRSACRPSPASTSQIHEPDVSPLQVQGPRSKHADPHRCSATRSPTSVTTGARRPSSTGSPWSSRGRGGPGRSATSCTFAMRLARHGALGPRDGGGRRVPDPSDRTQRPAPHGGRDLQLRQRHGRHEQPVRDHRSRAAGGARQRQRGRRARGARADRRPTASGSKLVGVRLDGPSRSRCGWRTSGRSRRRGARWGA